MKESCCFFVPTDLSSCSTFILVPDPIARLCAAAEAAQRLRRDEEVLDAPEVGGAQEEHFPERVALYT